MIVDGKAYGSPYQSDLLAKSGTISVIGTALDSRGFSSELPQEISVIPYAKPSIVPYTGENSIVCRRCDYTGIFSHSGIYLRIKAGRQYSKVISNGVQKNFCALRIKYKADGASSWIDRGELLSEADTKDIVDITLTDINLAISTTYLIQIEATDTIGESYSMIITVPTADTTYHLRKGGKAIGIGKYAEKDYIVDIDEEWEVNARGDLRVGGTLYPKHIASIDAYSNKDFNELVYVTGYYTGSSAPSSASCLNYPIDKTGLLEVISAMAQNKTTLAWWGFAYQTYRTHDGDVYMRSYYSSSGWTAWKKILLS